MGECDRCGVGLPRAVSARESCKRHASGLSGGHFFRSVTRPAYRAALWLLWTHKSARYEGRDTDHAHTAPFSTNARTAHHKQRAAREPSSRGPGPTPLPTCFSKRRYPRHPRRPKSGPHNSVPRRWELQLAPRRPAPQPPGRQQFRRGGFRDRPGGAVRVGRGPERDRALAVGALSDPARAGRAGARVCFRAFRRSSSSPDLVLLIFLPPLLYAAAFFSDLRALRSDAARDLDERRSASCS